MNTNYPQNPEQFSQPKKSRPVRYKVFAGLGVVAGLFLIMGIVGAATGSGSETAATVTAAPQAAVTAGATPAAPPATTAAVSSAQAAPSTPAAPASTQPAAPSQADQIAAWVTTPGYTDLLTVQADLAQLSTDATAGNMPGAETDAALLAADAQTAEDNPPPVGTGTYTAAMRDYATAGTDAAAGDFADATVSMSAGTVLINLATTAVNKAGS